MNTQHFTGNEKVNRGGTGMCRMLIMIQMAIRTFSHAAVKRFDCLSFSFIAVPPA